MPAVKKMFRKEKPGEKVKAAVRFTRATPAKVEEIIGRTGARGAEKRGTNA